MIFEVAIRNTETESQKLLQKQEIQLKT